LGIKGVAQGLLCVWLLLSDFCPKAIRGTATDAFNEHSGWQYGGHNFQRHKEFGILELVLTSGAFDKGEKLLANPEDWLVKEKSTLRSPGSLILFPLLMKNF